jgi:cell division ATPase FtsA
MKKKKTITRHDIVRAVNMLNHSTTNLVTRLELLEKNFGEYVEMNNNVENLKKYQSKKKEGKQKWIDRLKKWLKTLLKGKADQS